MTAWPQHYPRCRLIYRAYHSKPSPPLWSVHHRKGNNKPLPLSSFFDPIRLAQRHKRRLPKSNPPKYEQLDEFRRKVADNPYARILAEPVRVCKYTKAALPSSLLVKLNQLRISTADMSVTYVPLALNQSARSPADLTGLPLGKAESFTLSAEVIEAVEKAEQKRLRKEQKISKKGADAPGLIPQLVKAVDHLLVESIYKSLHWPIRHLSNEFIRLDSGIDDIHGIQDVAALLYLGAAATSSTIRDLERKVMESAAWLDRTVEIALRRAADAGFASISNGAIYRAHPRTRYEALRLLTVDYITERQQEVDGIWAPDKYRIPVFPLVHILGHERAGQLLKNTRFEDAEYIAVRYSRYTVAPLQSLIKGLIWSSNLNPETRGG